jgi:hypothetical protein
MKAIFEIPVPTSCNGRDVPCKARSICPVNYKVTIEAMKCLETGRVPIEYDKSRHPDCPLKIVEDSKEAAFANYEVRESQGNYYDDVELAFWDGFEAGRGGNS